MIPSRGVIQSVSLVGRRIQASPQLTTKGFATRHGRDGRQFSTAMQRPTGGALVAFSQIARATRRIPIGPLSLGAMPASTSRSLSLWGWGGGSSSKNPGGDPSTVASASAGPTPEAASATAPVTAPIPEQAAAPPSVDSYSSLDLGLFDGGTIAEMPEKIGYLRELGLDFGWGTTSCLQWLLEHVHVWSGLPWWGSIAATALVLRLVMTVPLGLAQDTTTRISLLKVQEPEYVEASKKMLAAATNPNALEQQKLKLRVRTLEAKYGIKKGRAFYNFIQAPIGFGMYRILSNMSSIPVPGLETGGSAWFPDLAVPDPLYLLPLVGPATMMFTMAVASRYSPPSQKAMMKLMTLVLTPIMLVVTTQLPAALQFYFVCYAVPGLLQTYLIYQPWVRRLFGMKELPDAEMIQRLHQEQLDEGKRQSGESTAIKDSGLVGQVKGTWGLAKKDWSDSLGHRREARQADQALQKEAEKARQYWESLRDRMAEQEKNIRNRRP